MVNRKGVDQDIGVSGGGYQDIRESGIRVHLRLMNLKKQSQFIRSAFSVLRTAYWVLREGS
jgi:hypothetical protein